MGETKVAQIPRVVVAGALGPKDYGILLTDQRMIFVLEFASKAGIGGALGGMIGAAIAGAASSRRYVDYQTAAPDALAMDDKNLVVPYAAIQSLTAERKLGSYRLLVEYATPEGKRKKIAAMIAPPSEMVTQNKSRGIKPKQTAAEYARTAQSALQAAMPAAVATRAEWRL